jgi:diguanylate cyclase (GGDEF)-like protein/PAS domain S-box-containing protein
MSSTLSDSPKQNRILAALAPSDFARLQDDLELVSVKLGQVLFESGDNLGYVYFPADCIVSLIFTTQSGSSAELAISGNDGLVGIPLVLGGNTTTHRAVVQSAGTAYRLKVEVMRWELDQGGDFLHLTLRYTQALMTQMAQSVVCNRHHSVDQQLCRWLLLSLDRLPGNQLNMTQELIANMLGVRREAVTEAAGKLQTAGLIQYSRGHITIVDRAGLEARVCECYATVKREYQRLFELNPIVRLKGRVRPNPETMRQRAEARLLQTLPDLPKTDWENAQLVHELQVHQIELEMHNEELRHAYDEADALRDRYADLYDFAPLGYFTLDAQGVIIDLNLAGAVLLGIKGSQKGRHRFAANVAERDLPAFGQFHDAVLKARQKLVCEIVLSATSQRPEAIVRIEAVPDEDGRECRMVVTDISTEKRAEMALQVREEYQRAVLDNFPFMVWLKDAESRFLAVNKPFVDAFSLVSADSVSGKTDFDITPLELAKLRRAEDVAVLESGKKLFVEEQIETNGEPRWFEVYKSPVELAGQAIGTVGFARDIHERHLTQQALKQSEKRFRQLIEKLPLGIAIAQDGLLKYVNPKGLAMTGYLAGECLEKSFLPLVHEADRPWAMEAHLAHSRREAMAEHAEIRLLGKAGQVLDCRLHVNSVEWEGRVAALIIFEDVTLQKAMAAELQRLARADALTGLATREHFLDHVEQALSRLRRNGEQKMAVLIFDLDHFMGICKMLGQASGDAILHLFSALLGDELRKVDFAGRIGCDQFAVLLPETDVEAALMFAERVRRKAAATSVSIGDRQASITVGIGVAGIGASDSTAEHVMQRAAEALARAKLAGGNRTEVADDAELVEPIKGSRTPPAKGRQSNDAQHGKEA